jgi:hypothetical protein
MCAHDNNKKIDGGTRFKRRGCDWCRATTMSSERIASIMGWKILAMQMYSLVFFKLKHQQK